MVSSALSPCSSSRPAARRRPRLRTQSTVKFMQREERPPRQSPETPAVSHQHHLGWSSWCTLAPRLPDQYLQYIYRISTVYLLFYCCVRTLVCMARCEKGGVTVKTTCQYYTGGEGGTRRSGPVLLPRARRGRLCYIRSVARINDGRDGKRNVHREYFSIKK